MKLKEAIQILTDFQKIAGEDALVHITDFRLVGGIERKFSQVAYGMDRHTDKVSFAVVVQSIDDVKYTFDPDQS